VCTKENSHGEGPVSTGEGANDIGASGRQDIVDGVGRRDDALATSSGSAASEPAHNIASLLVVERLRNPMVLARIQVWSDKQMTEETHDGFGRMPMVLSRKLGAVVRDDVNC
jgi:hypothetical protein